MSEDQLFAATIGILSLLAGIFGAAFLWKPRPRKLRPKPQALTDAERDLNKEDLRSAVVNLFIAIERSLKETLGEKKAAFELIDLAKAKGLIDGKSQDFLHQLRLLRNRLVHEGAVKLTKEKVAYMLEQTRKVLSSIGYVVRG